MLEGKKTYETWQEGFYNIFMEVSNNKPFVMNVYHSLSHEHIENYLYKLTYQLIKDVVEEMSKGIPVREKDKYFIADFYKYSFVELVLNWIKNDMQEDPKEIIKELTMLMQGNILNALENYRTDKINEMIKNYNLYNITSGELFSRNLSGNARGILHRVMIAPLIIFILSYLTFTEFGSLFIPSREIGKKGVEKIQGVVGAHKEA